MAPEALLPSEIARLVYGYLIEEKCTEIAKSFLNESPNLYECRMILQRGKTFTIHPFGLTLLNILDTFCTINCIVQDHLVVYDKTNKLKNKDIVTQLKFLLGECCKSQQAVSSSESAQNEHAASGSPLKVHKKCHSGKNENGLNVALQSDDGYQTETPPDSNSLQNIPSLEATPSEHLPGYVEGLQSKSSETSWPPAIKSPSKVTNKFTQSQQIKENVRSQVVQTPEIQKICQATQIEKTVQSQEIQTSVSQKIPVQERHESDKNLNTDSAVTCVGDELSNCYKPKTDLRNNLGNGHRAEEVINLDDSGEHTSLGSHKSANSIVFIDENASSPEDVDVEMDIDNGNPSSEENECVTTEDKKQCHPKAMNVSPITQNSQAIKVPEMTNLVIVPKNTLIPDPQIPPSIVPNNVPNDKCLVNSIEPSLFDKDFPNPSEFPNHITSTPLKLFAAVQNYDNNEWFSAQTLPSSGIVPQETAGLNYNFTYVQTATESIVSPVEDFISPIICKENTKVAEKISLNCLVSNARKDDDTLNTPEVPPLNKSFVPSLPAPVSVTFVQPKNKAPELPKDPNPENTFATEQTVQDTLPNFSSISSLVKNTEFNRYFSIDSISVIQIDTTNTAETSSAVPKVENSVRTAGTGLTPLVQMQKMTQDGNVEAQKNESSTTSEEANNGIIDNEKVVEVNAEAGDVIMEDLSGEKSKESNGETNDVEEMVLTPPISRSTHEMIAQTVVNEVEKVSGIVATEEIVDEVDMNEDVEGETVDVNPEEKVDSASKDMTSDGINGEPEKGVGETVKDVQVETIETNKSTKEKSEDATGKVPDKMDVSIESTKHEDPEAAMTSGKKESLKSILSKKFESYIDAAKESTASNHNNETTRNTPKVTVEERAKRRSLSTPKKTNSHIRALTFETPIQSHSDSKIKDLVRPTSPETAKRNLKRVHESFQSPPVGDYEIDNQVQINEVSANTVNEKENVDDQNVGDTSGTLSQNKDTRDENVRKKSWDSDLRILVGPPYEPPKVEVPKRKYKTKSKEGSSTKKKKRDKSKTPRKEKTPHKKKSHKHDKSKENRDDKKKDGKNAKTKADDKLSAKDFKDLGAQIESNLLSNENDKIEIKKKTDDKLSAKECKDISALIESNLLLNKNDQVVNESENKKKVDDNLFAKKCGNISAHFENNTTSSKNNIAIEKVKVKSKVEEKLSAKNARTKIMNNLIRHKHIKPNLNVARNKQTSTEKKSTKDETKEVSTKDDDQLNVIPCVTNVMDNCEKMVTEVEDNVPSREPTQQPSITKTTSKKDPLEYLLSDSITDDDVLNDIMQMDSDDLSYHQELSRGNTQIDREIAEKMQQDEEAFAAVLEEANQAVNGKYNSVEEEKTEDFFPDTSLMTDGDESQEEGELMEDVVVEKKELKKNADKTLDNSSKRAVDYDSIEQQLSIITNAEPTRKVIYDQVSKVEDGKVVKKKYARLKTLDTKLAAKKCTLLGGGYEVELDPASDSMEMPPTPHIADPGSNSWVPNSTLIRDDSQKTVHCSVPTPLECPPTPKIFITPRKEETVDAVPEKAETVPYYHLTAITFETAKKPEVTEFEVVKEVLKKTTPKTPAEKKEGEGKVKKTSRSARSKSRDKSASRSRMDDSEDSDSSSSSSSSDSSDSSSSSSDDEDDSTSRQPSGVLKAIEVPAVTGQKVEVLVENEEVVIGNEVIFVEHEEVVVAHESSPAKVFLIKKNDEELAETATETPAKDENMIPEEGIFETPNVSKPVDNPTNLHAKISQMMILREQEEMRKLESQQKQKIVDVENLAPKIAVKDSKAKIVEKSEAEVAKAVESIASEKFDKSLEELNASVGCNKAPEVLKDKVKKRELSKAIQSITVKGDEEDSSDSSSDFDSSSDDEPNLQLVLEDDVKGAEDSTDESLGLDNSEAQHAEFHIVFDEANYKKRRRKQFTDDEMMCEPHLEDGRLLAKITPSCVDILLNIHPAKKKVGSKKKGEVREEGELDDGDSSEDFVPAKSTRGGTKRRRSNDESKSRKRKKNMFIY